MENNLQIIQELKEQGFLPLFNHADLEVNIKIIQILYDLKIYYFEFTNRGIHPEYMFKQLQKYVKKNMPNMKLGVGTIKTFQDAESYNALKPAFMVSPHYTKNIHNIVSLNNICWIPGAYTPTEIYNLEFLNFKLIKIFPANNIGFDFIKSIKSVYPKVHLMVSGGIETNPTVLKNWKQAGVSIVGLGSSLFTENIIKNNNWATLQTEIKKIQKNLQEK